MRQHLSWQKMETRFCVVCGLKEERVLLVFDCLLTSETPSAAAAFRRWDTCSAKPPWRARTPILILHFLASLPCLRSVVALRQPAGDARASLSGQSSIRTSPLWATKKKKSSSFPRTFPIGNITSSTSPDAGAGQATRATSEWHQWHRCAVWCWDGGPSEG